MLWQQLCLLSLISNSNPRRPECTLHLNESYQFFFLTKFFTKKDYPLTKSSTKKNNPVRNPRPSPIVMFGEFQKSQFRESQKKWLTSSSKSWDWKHSNGETKSVVIESFKAEAFYRSSSRSMINREERKSGETWDRHALCTRARWWLNHEQSRGLSDPV